MAFFDEGQLAKLRIERMVFHLVGPKDDDLVKLEAIDPGKFEGFFLERIRSVNLGLPYIFSDDSAARERLKRIDEDGSSFQQESESLVEDFQRLHGGSTAAGAFLIFVLNTEGQKSFALLKYDDETVLTYDVKNLANGRKRVSLEALERTFVQNKSALQKSALIRLTNHAGELTVLDRRNQQKVARYFENFLDVVRLYNDADLTLKIVGVTRQLIKENKSLVPPSVYREVTKRTFEASAAGGKIDAENQKSFLEAVMGQKLPDDAPLVAKFSVALRKARIEGMPITLNSDKVVRPRTIRYRTKLGIDIRVPLDLIDLIDTRGDNIIINDALDPEQTLDDTA